MRLAQPAWNAHPRSLAHPTSPAQPGSEREPRSGVAHEIDLSLHLSRPPAVATMPAELRGVGRDQVKLLVLNRQTGATQHARFNELPRFLQAGDVLVVNNSAVIPARLRARFEQNPMMVHVCTRLSASRYIVERRTAAGGPDARQFRTGDVIHIDLPTHKTRLDHPRGVHPQLIVEQQFHPNSRLWLVRSNTDLFPLARAFGEPIQYAYLRKGIGMNAYDSVFARVPGSAEMPSASRPFTLRTLRDLAARGVRIASLVLHTGVSSHEVQTDLAHHPVIPEWYVVPPCTAAIVNKTRMEGRRVIAVGTTVVRALESAVNTRGQVDAASGWTTLLVTPQTPPRVVTGLITGMHEDHSSHLALLYGFVPPHLLQRAYEEAVQQDYLWHEFGDINLIL